MADTTVSERPRRADAQRNRQRLVDAARESFQSKGSDASLECIAKAAEVGIGTLYRHFPNRLDLVVAIYRDDIDALVARSRDTDQAPWDALLAWVDVVRDFGWTKRALMEELRVASDNASELFQQCRTDLVESADRVLVRAQEAGVVRRDVDAAVLLRTVGAVASAQHTTPEQTEMMIKIVLDGLRA